MKGWRISRHSGVFKVLFAAVLVLSITAIPFPSTIGRVQHGFDVRPDLCAVDNNVKPIEYIGKFYVDSLVHDPSMLEYLLNLFGPNHIALGTDYPFPLGEAEPGKLIESLGISKKIKSNLLGQNALNWLGIKVNEYQV